jgi:hypothetical protein
MNKPHSILPPSSADKWMVCHGWYRAVEDIPSKSSIYAEEGTAAHAVLESCLRLDMAPSDVTDDVDLALNLSVVTDWLSEYRKKNPECDYLVEQWVSWGTMLNRPDLGGTIDLGTY